MTRSVRVVLEDVDLGVSFVTANASLVPRPSPLPAGPYFARSFNSNVVVAMVVLILAIVVGAFVSTVVRVMRRWRRQRQRESPPPPQPPQQQQVELAAKGLDPRAIEALPVVAYGAAAADDDDNVECVVCLSEFVHGEKLRMLPECHHAFHVACIDAWLVTHKTCPVCRQSLVTRSASVDVEPENSHSSRSFRSHFPSETVAILVHSALGSRRFGLRSQGG